MSTIICDVAVVPLGTGQTSLSRYVAAVMAVLQHHPTVKSRLTPMSTVLEGEWDAVMAALRAMHEAPFALGALRVSTRLVIDDRRDQAATMESKLEAVRLKR
jgi:uncharacterized protein (TIGR00106 family)